MKLGEMQRGFNPVFDQLELKGKYVASCNSCRHFFAKPGEEEESCQNGIVTPFDIVEDDNRVYCVYWAHGGRRKDD